MTPAEVLRGIYGGLMLVALYVGLTQGRWMPWPWWAFGIFAVWAMSWIARRERGRR